MTNFPLTNEQSKVYPKAQSNPKHDWPVPVLSQSLKTAAETRNSRSPLLGWSGFRETTPHRDSRLWLTPREKWTRQCRAQRTWPRLGCLVLLGRSISLPTPAPPRGITEGKLRSKESQRICVNATHISQYSSRFAVCPASPDEPCPWIRVRLGEDYGGEDGWLPASELSHVLHWCTPFLSRSLSLVPSGDWLLSVKWVTKQETAVWWSTLSHSPKPAWAHMPGCPAHSEIDFDRSRPIGEYVLWTLDSNLETRAVPDLEVDSVIQ